MKNLMEYKGYLGFHEAVEDYLELARTQNIEPEQPFKGSFNVRTGSELHRRVAIAAKQKGINLNKLVNEALEQYLGLERILLITSQIVEHPSSPLKHLTYGI